jgi:hypothetical protein
MEGRGTKVPVLMNRIRSCCSPSAASTTSCLAPPTRNASYICEKWRPPICDAGGNRETQSRTRFTFHCLREASYNQCVKNIQTNLTKEQQVFAFPPSWTQPTPLDSSVMVKCARDESHRFNGPIVFQSESQFFLLQSDPCSCASSSEPTTTIGA